MSLTQRQMLLAVLFSLFFFNKIRIFTPVHRSNAGYAVAYTAYPVAPPLHATCAKWGPKTPADRRTHGLVQRHIQLDRCIRGFPSILLLPMGSCMCRATCVRPCIGTCTDDSDPSEFRNDGVDRCTIAKLASETQIRSTFSSVLQAACADHLCNLYAC